MAKTTAKKNSKRSFVMELEIDFKSDLGLDFPVNNTLAKAIGDAAIKTIVKRTESGKRSDTGQKFKKYKASYAKSKGVGVGDVNLKLFGDMLDSLDVVEVGLDSVTIGFDSSAEKPKAFNHHVGDTLPKRPWFGIQKKELNKIKGEFSSRIRVESSREEEERKRIRARERAEEEAIEEIAEQIAGQVLNFG